MRTSRGLHVRLLGFAAWCVLVVAVLEGVSFVLFWAAAGRRFSYEAVAREQAFEINISGPPPAAEPPGATMPPAPRGPVTEGRIETTPEEILPHPFMGFTFNPENAALTAEQGQGALPRNEHGFFSLPNPPAGDDALSVAVFGGSVAAYFSQDARETIARVLQADPRLRDKRVQVQCLALSGFKQPQMLGALAYLMSLGQRYDVVVELDGFNDVVLSYVEYKQKGTFPGYPRDWDGLVGLVPDVARWRRMGRVAWWQEQRGAVAARFARPPLSWSVTGGLVWKCLDRLLSGRLAAAREDLMKAQAQGFGYRERGPVRRYASDQELVADIARIWGLSSLQMQRLCAGAGTRYFHFLQPNQYVPGSKPIGDAERAVAFRADHPYRPAVELGYPVMRAEGARLPARGVDFHDLSQLYAGVSEPLYIDDCCHINARGNALMGEAVGKVIVGGWKP